MQIEYKPLGSEVIMYVRSGVKEIKEISQYLVNIFEFKA